MFKKGLIRPPTLRSGQDAVRERHASWLELFYDLVFVAAVSQLATTLTTEYTLGGFLKFCALYIPIWWAWAGHTYYLTRFDANDVGHRLLTMVQMMAVAALVVNAADAVGTTSAGFALSYAAVRFMLVAQYGRAARHIPAVRPLIYRYMAGFGSAAALWALSALVSPPYRFWIWGIALVVDFLAPLTAGSLHVRVPPHLAHLPERFGLFTIIVLGEEVVSVVLGVRAQGLTAVSGAAGVMGLVIAFALWWGYFEGVKGAAVLQLRSKDDVRRYQQWLYAHLPLTMGIVGAAVGVKHVIALGYRELLPPTEAWLLGISVAVSLLSLHLILLASSTARNSPGIHRITGFHITTGFLVGIAGALGTVISGLSFLGIIAGLCVIQIVYALREMPAEAAD